MGRNSAFVVQSWSKSALFHSGGAVLSDSTCLTSLTSMASKYGQPVMQNLAMHGICKYTLERYLEEHLRRIRGCLWCWRWVKGCKVITSRVTTSFHPTALEMNFRRESWLCWEQSEETSQNSRGKFWRCRAVLCIPQYLFSLRKQQLFHTAQRETRMFL